MQQSKGNILHTEILLQVKFLSQTSDLGALYYAYAKFGEEICEKGRAVMYSMVYGTHISEVERS